MPPPTNASKSCSAASKNPTVPEPAPSAFIKPISVRRSITEAAEEAPTANAAASSAAPVTSHNSMRTRLRICPSPSATRRTTRTSAPGKTCLIEYAIEETYGLQDHRSNSPAFIVFGSRRAKSSSGLVRALTYSLRYWPGLPANCWATESGTMTASSSDPPDESTPTTFKLIHFAWSPELTFKSSPIFAPTFFEKFAPTTHCSESSPNHCPLTSHQGFVFSAPVRYVVPSGMATLCCAQVPIKVALPATAGVIQELEAGDQASIGNSRIGLKPIMLLCQKMVLSLGRSASGRYAPAFTGR